jgi:hypothetical protein
MNTTTKRLGLLLPSAALLCAAVPDTASAADPNRISIPASACQLDDPDDFALLEFENGSWVFVAGETGSVDLVCPVGRKEDFFEGDNWSFARMRLWYRDTDGTGSAANVTAQLSERTTTSAGSPFGPLIESSDSNTMSNTTRIANVNHVIIDAMYYVTVRVRRNNTTQTPAFHGVDFLAPEPEG